MRWAVAAFGLCAVAGVFILTGCGDDETTTSCEYCDHWSLLMDAFARHPAFSPDPIHVDRMAFSSRMPNPDGVVEEEPFEHIWVLDGEDLYQITDDEFNDFAPAWSPDGGALSFTRELAGRLDVWIVEIADLATPGEPVRLTSESTVSMGASESSWTEIQGELWVVFSSEGDVYRVHASGGSPIKLIPDPNDIVGACEFGTHEDFQPAVGLDGRIAFTSIGRGQVGVLEVNAFFVETGGETTEVADAEIYLDDCPTGFRTPHVFSFLPVKPDLGPYSVSAESPQHCDRRYLYPVVRPNQDVRIRFDFAETKGHVLIVVNDATHIDFFDAFEGDTTLVAEMRRGLPVPDSVLVRCLSPGDHVIIAEWANIAAEVPVSIETYQTTRVEIFRPTAKGWSRMAGLWREEPQARRVRPVQTGLAQVWVADLTHRQMVGFWSISADFERACWSPDGRYVAFLASDPVRNLWGIRIAAADGSSPVWSVPLPGSSGSAACARSAYQLSWNSDGTMLAASLGDCASGDDPQELQIWTVDPAPFLGK